MRTSRGDAFRSRFEEGFGAGYADGLLSGKESFGTYFQGTSIIIPSHNKLRYLKLCIASIVAHTNQPYEIIVVDNASTDGTAQYLRTYSGRERRLRYATMSSNAGFAGAVNRGLMLAKGTTMLLLNNDTIVTPRWLDNLLACLNSDPSIGIVGPVTNYISGDQLIKVPYRSIRGMNAFARRHNVSDAAKWQETERLTGFCMLFNRSVWERAGYLDEGYQIGNFEDDDYNVRVRLLGGKLVIARDTFIHHYGSVSIRALGKQKIAAVNRNNREFYEEKWGNPHKLLAETAAWRSGLRPDEVHHRGETVFYPQGVAVNGPGGKLYWLKDGERRAIRGEWKLPSVRLSQVKMNQWPLGMEIDASAAAAEWDGADAPFICIVPGAGTYRVAKGCKRRIVSRAALEAWGLHHQREGTGDPAVVAALPDGLPIIAPEKMAQRL
ncbi:glycosyltransferase family 2 protein [Paenibacillus beijingensis]|uniref:Glycosyltransferase 2-like domain-containing protein n=1 Tax=Paenibacillus beijingensis TaxID=1126833 RepID=A0A0D5NFA5_9BACL|nr:glycosyltransferase family 2 protein [Paenibacillus beijingensis]AJY73603.1 hypothetical protein VN24_01875 [Paenibacillus beijingensis]